MQEMWLSFFFGLVVGSSALALILLVCLLLGGSGKSPWHLSTVGGATTTTFSSPKGELKDDGIVPILP